MVVDVCLINVCCDNKSVVAFCPAHAELVADTVCFFRGHFSGEEGLPYLITQNVLVPLLHPARDGLIFALESRNSASTVAGSHS